MLISKILIGISVAILLATSTIMTGALYAQQVTINGAGATFPFPLIDTWRVEYQKVKPDVNINYQSIGSGGALNNSRQKQLISEQLMHHCHRTKVRMLLEQYISQKLLVQLLQPIIYLAFLIRD